MRERKIKILHILAGGKIGGAERSVQWLAQTYDKQKFEIAFVFLYFGGHIQQALEDMGFAVHVLNWKSGHSLWGRYKLLRLIWLVKPDVVHFHDATPFVKIFVKLFFPFLPIIYTCHGIESASRLVIAGQIIDDKFTDRVIANSNFTRDAYGSRHHRNTASIKIIYLGLYLEKYRNSVWAEPVKRPVKEDFINLIYLGRLVGYKGVLDLPLLAMELQKIGFNDFRINIVGDGPLRYKISDLAKLMGVEDYVDFSGSQQNVIEYLKNSDILVFPSWWEEPFGLVLLEAIASGLSIVAYQSGAVAEAIGNYPFARIVEKKNIGAMAAAIVNIAKNKTYPDISVCIDYLEKDFDIRRTVQQIEVIYRDLLLGRLWDNP